jgi:hypothetical protein
MRFICAINEPPVGHNGRARRNGSMIFIRSRSSSIAGLAKSSSTVLLTRTCQPIRHRGQCAHGKLDAKKIAYLNTGC